jgi:hypothetical protein
MEMSPSDYALVISVLSICIASGSLLWNIWQKFLFVKPQLQVSFAVWKVVQSGSPRLLILSVTNMGPGPALLQACTAKPKKPWWRRAESYDTINPIHGNPLDLVPTTSGPFASPDGTPVKLDAGEIKQFYFPYTKDCFLKKQLTQVGINDTYQRLIWCRRLDMKKVYASYHRDFGR